MKGESHEETRSTHDRPELTGHRREIDTYQLRVKNHFIYLEHLVALSLFQRIPKYINSLLISNKDVISDVSYL